MTDGASFVTARGCKRLISNLLTAGSRTSVFSRFTSRYSFRFQEFILAEFEFQIDELLHKLDVISGAAPSSSSAPPPLSAFPPFAHSSTAETRLMSQSQCLQFEFQI